MTIRFIMKSGAEFTCKCEKFTLRKNVYGGFVGYDIEGITEGKPLYIEYGEVSAIVRQVSDEPKGSDAE